MLKKLCGLLLFSQGAIGRERVDITNYQKHFCDSGLFFPAYVPQILPEGVYFNPKQKIRDDYSIYCGSRITYEQEVRSQNSFGNEREIICGQETARECVALAGVGFGMSCDQLRFVKEKHPKEWNEVLPELTGCGTPCTVEGRDSIATLAPTEESIAPTNKPTSEPTQRPTQIPTERPSSTTPTPRPTKRPSSTPTPRPTKIPTSRRHRF